MLYKVNKVLDNLYIQLDENWKWNDSTGNCISIKCLKECNTFDHKQLCNRLHILLSDQIVDLRNPLNLNTGCLFCDVFLQGTNVIELLREG